MEVIEADHNLSQQPLLANVQKLTGIGPQLAEKLAKLNIVTILDLLLHLPYKYQDRTRLTPIADLQLESHVVIEGEVVDVKLGFTRAKKRTLTVYLQDTSGVVELKFFQFNQNQLQQFKTNPVLRCFGEIKYGQRTYAMFHPEYQVVSDKCIQPVEENLRPIYPSTEGLSQKRWLQIIDLALKYLEKYSNSSDNLEYLPAYIVEDNNLIDFSTAIKFIHKPPPDVQLELLENKVHQAQQRLIFEELLAQQLAMRLHKSQQNKYSSHVLTKTNLSKKLLDLLPFELTKAQARVYQEISCDMTKQQPMSRLLQGDVGAGKTIVAALIILQAVASGNQAALMAPTEILAEQHYLNLKKYFDMLGISAELLLSKQSKKIKTDIKTKLANNELSIIIGTHAIIQDDVEFYSLGLIIIDEQHRFGVEQRMTLWQKGVKNNKAPHQLTMTATPIPRTLAMTIYSDMDYSVIDELPPGRKPVTTVAISCNKRDDVISRIKSVCEQGRQVYWVCTLIEESEVLACKAAEDSHKELLELLSPLKIGLVHGRMKAGEKSQVMSDFKNNNINVLVATTVIEVGVDVPNASLMIIENPERLGLSQLHQLRGRVGRGQYESFCVLLYKSPLNSTAQTRLNIMRETNDGFKLAEYDLKIRGSGELLGKRQTGIWNLKIADLVRDRSLLPQVNKAVEYIIQSRPNLIIPLVKLWLGENYKLGSV